jgi:hypothetical protein
LIGWERRNVYRYLTRNLLGKRPLGKTRTWENNIKMDLKEAVFEDRGWIELSPDSVQLSALVFRVLNFRILLK